MSLYWHRLAFSSYFNICYDCIINSRSYLYWSWQASLCSSSCYNYFCLLLCSFCLNYALAVERRSPRAWQSKLSCVDFHASGWTVRLELRIILGWASQVLLFPFKFLKTVEQQQKGASHHWMAVDYALHYLDQYHVSYYLKHCYLLTMGF